MAKNRDRDTPANLSVVYFGAAMVVDADGHEAPVVARIKITAATSSCDAQRWSGSLVGDVDWVRLWGSGRRKFVRARDGRAGEIQLLSLVSATAVDVEGVGVCPFD